ncbi:AraC-like DNA-binding protein [Novosphingobium sp. 1529]|uniref:helix-turn-helix transcriptional regulator n=1 Tax=Novosphingobium sp. 1529 TaxID=3156424 RepID=UPI00145A4091
MASRYAVESSVLDLERPRVLSIEQRILKRFGPVGVRPVGVGKPAYGVEWRKSCMGLAFTAHLNGIKIERQAGALNAHWGDMVFLVQQKAGTAFCREAGMEFRAQPGEIVIVDPSLKSSLESDGLCRFMALGIPRHVVETLENRGLNPLHNVIRKGSGVSSLLAGTIDLLLKPAEPDHFTARTAYQVLSDLLSASLELQQQSSLDCERQLLEEMRNWVMAHVGVTRVGVHEIAREFAFSDRSLYRLFARNGTTPDRWLWSCRLDVARKRLARPIANITQIAFETGFKDVSHFSRMFRKTYGTTPSDFRARCQVPLL